MSEKPLENKNELINPKETKTQMFLDSIEKADDDFCEIVLSGQGRGVMCRDINLD